MPDTILNTPITEDSLPHLREEHRMLRAQVRRFVQEQVKPRADEWEETGMVPRDILRQMGALGFLGIRYPEEYGGSAMDAIATAVLAEELGRSTFGGFSVTVLVHTDMASPHLAHAGSAEQMRRWMPGSFPANASRRSRLRSPTPDRTWRRCERQRGAKAIPMC